MGAVVIVGMGEVGQPLFRILSRNFDCVAVDIEPVEIRQECDVLHVCYPFQVSDFVGTTSRYIQKYAPNLTIINSTVAPGTTRRIQQSVPGSAIVYSPVRGKHARMEADMLQYKKFVGGSDSRAVELARRHFCKAGFQTDSFYTPEIGELSKLLETTYLGVLVAWAQEVERLAIRCGGSFEEVVSFIKEVDFLPSHIFPGVIGGHCVMPNIAILREHYQSEFLEVVVNSNTAKAREKAQETRIQLEQPQ